MAITPSTDLKLLKVNINIDEKNQLTFSDTTAQYNYFNSLPKLEVDNFTYQRADGIIRYPAHIDSIINYNYCMYRNDNYSNKWFYAFITGMRYINDNMTEISIKTDVWQTWFNDITIMSSYVEREHVNDDTIGINTVPEGLELGEYINCQEEDELLYDPTSDFYICMAATGLPSDSFTSQDNHLYNGVYNGLKYFAFTTAAECTNAVNSYAEAGRLDYIQSIFMIPNNLTCISDGTSHTWTSPKGIVTNLIYLANSTSADTVGNLTGTMPTKLGIDYTPRNNKLFTHPFSYMLLSNNSGTSVPFYYEDFDVEDGERVIGFWVDACICPGMSMKAIPLYYKNKNMNYEYGIPLGKLPVGSWTGDVYTNWLTQNSLNIGISYAENMTKMATGNVAGGFSGILQTQAEVYQRSLVPNQSFGNMNCGDVNFSNIDDGGLTLYYMSIRDEYAARIDSFFDMFGYKVNLVKIPNIYGRPNWNYVKTIDVNIEGYIPQGDLQEIKNMFNSGVTFWHSASTFLDYTQDNSIPEPTP